MLHSGNRNRGGLDLAVGGKQLLEGSERSAAEFAGSGIGTQQVRINDADQPDGFTGLLELLVYASVVASEGAYADDRDIDGALGVQGRLSTAVAADCRLYLRNQRPRTRFFAGSQADKPRVRDQVWDFFRSAICPA
jgi:hypothetical protein